MVWAALDWDLVEREGEDLGCGQMVEDYCGGYLVAWMNGCKVVRFLDGNLAICPYPYSREHDREMMSSYTDKEQLGGGSSLQCCLVASELMRHEEIAAMAGHDIWACSDGMNCGAA
ncbi:hypothetical protein M0R45_016416 [Rubus argutus]|uniref:4Fe4S-binding SPASM domain-containing protein n=1 Tax=Rubus argutus TaxID=59490 RepID=A0AAW1XT07_RUBAR